MEIPGLNFKINSTSLFSENGSIKRLQLSFNAKARANYRVRFTSSLSGVSSIVPFATISSQPVTQTLWSQPNDGPRNLWVEYTGDRGFYSVEMVTDEYSPF